MKADCVTLHFALFVKHTCMESGHNSWDSPWLNLLKREFQCSPLKLEEVLSDGFLYHVSAVEEHAPPKRN